MLAELGSQVGRLADRAELSENEVKVIVRKVQMRLVMPDGFDVKGVRSGMGKPCCLQAARTRPHSRK